VLERNLINQTDVDRLVDAPDFAASFKALNDTDYGAHMLDVEPSEFREALDAESRHVRDLMLAWIDDSALLEFMFLQYDAHNIKLYLKTKHTGADVEAAELNSSATGLTRAELIKQVIILDQKDTVLHPTTDMLLKDSMDALGSDPDGFMIDSTVDRILFHMLDERVQLIRSSIVRDLFRIQKETATVKTLIRAKLMNLPAERIQASLPENFQKHYELDLEQAAEQLPIDVRIKKAIVNYIDHKLLWEFEKELEEVELDVIRATKWKTDGLEPAVGYFYAKNNAARNVRLILTAKQNEISAEDIKPRIRALY